MTNKINPSFLDQFEDRLFPCNITRDNYSKKQVKLPIGWNSHNKKFEDFNESNANSIAVRTGQGLLVVDIDTKELPYLESYMKVIVEKWLSDKATFTVETTNGYHFYFDSEESTYGNAVRISDYVDIRGDGGCVFCYTEDSKSSYSVICESDPLPLTDELIEYLHKKEPTQIQYTINDDNLKITQTGHDYNKNLANAIHAEDIDGVLNSLGYQIEDFINNESGLYTKLNRLAFLLAMNPACPNNMVREIVEYVLKELCNFNVDSELSQQKLYQIFSTMIYNSEEDIEDIFTQAYMPPEELRKMMVNSVPILGDFILKGQLSFIYGPPNSGKSLLIMHLLRNAPEPIVYLNADDNINEAVYKTEIAQRYNHKMIVCGSKNENDPYIVLKKMEMVLERNSKYYKDKIIIIDTVKKFVDVMSKKETRHFLQLMRKITLSGGTVVLLGHTNKITPQTKELVFEGVGDFMSDMDCTYELKTIVDSDIQEATLTLTNKKMRGSVPPSVAYTYNSSKDIQSFKERMDTLTPLREEDLKMRKLKLQRTILLHHYDDLYPLITDFLSENPKSSQSSIIQYLKKHGDCKSSEKEIRTCLTKLSGIAWEYQYNKKNNNTKEFLLLKEAIFIKA